MKKLTRSKDNRIISGVCAGVAGFLNIDPTLIRILCILLALKSTISFIVVYIISTIIIPEDDDVIYQSKNTKTKDNSNLILGISFILIGFVLLGRSYFPTFTLALADNFKNLIRQIKNLWPVLLIILGIYILIDKNSSK